MTQCIHCGRSVAEGGLHCPHCCQTQLPANRLNFLLSLSLIGAALLIAIGYWLLCIAVWLPLSQTGLIIVVNLVGLDGVVPHWTGAIPIPNFFNANWSLFGALVYIPIVTVILMRRGVQRAAALALFGPAPFTLMDLWSAWWRAVVAPPGANLADILRPLPGVPQFIVVLILSAIIIAAIHFLGTALTGALIKRFPRAAIIHIRQIGPVAPVAFTPAVQLEPGPAIPVEAVTAPAQAIEPEPASVPKDRPTQTESAPSPIRESVPPATRAVTEHSKPAAETASGENIGGIPAWMIVTGMAVLIIFGIVLIVFALRI
ncbi:MAG TPA: hypothetical protein VJ020_12860 [Anaerolineales bacterium]|nr:hypothetical protein [Anaerolineales bacterium]